MQTISATLNQHLKNTLARKTFLALLGAATISGFALRAMAQPAEVTGPLVKQSFEDGIGSWITIGEGAKVSLTREAANVKEQKTALQFDYRLKAGQYDLLVAPTPPGLLTSVKSIHFWIKTDTNAPLVLGVQEAGGGRYLAPFSVPANVWQQVEIEPSDFILSEDENDPKDPNNSLDLNKVEAVTIVDFNQFFIQDTEMSKVLNVKEGNHTFYLDDMKVSEEAPDLPAAEKGTVVIDSFAHPQIGWVSAGKAEISRVSDVGVDGPSIQADYERNTENWVAFFKPLPRGKLTGMQKLTFQVGSIKPAKLLVQVEEHGKGRYNALVDVPGGAQPKNVTLNFADFTRDKDSKDQNNELNLDRVKHLVFLDVTGLLGAGDGKNSLWIGKVTATN